MLHWLYNPDREYKSSQSSVSKVHSEVSFQNEIQPIAAQHLKSKFMYDTVMDYIVLHNLDHFPSKTEFCSLLVPLYALVSTHAAQNPSVKDFIKEVMVRFGLDYDKATHVLGLLQAGVQAQKSDEQLTAEIIHAI